MDETSVSKKVFESNPKNRINMGILGFMWLEVVENYLEQRYLMRRMAGVR
jgi:hypothetical protein